MFLQCHMRYQSSVSEASVAGEVSQGMPRLKPKKSALTPEVVTLYLLAVSLVL